MSTFDLWSQPRESTSFQSFQLVTPVQSRQFCHIVQCQYCVLRNNRKYGKFKQRGFSEFNGHGLPILVESSNCTRWVDKHHFESGTKQKEEEKRGRAKPGPGADIGQGQIVRSPWLGDPPPFTVPVKSIIREHTSLGYPVPFEYQSVSWLVHKFL